MNPELQEKLNRLGELDESELTAVRSQILAEFERVDAEELSADNVATMNALADAGDRVRAHVSRANLASAEVVTASGNGTGAVRRMASRQRPVTSSPERQGPPASAGTMKTMIVSGRFGSGEVLDSRQKLADFMTEAINSGKRGVCASAFWTYPEDRHLDGENVSKNEEVFRGAAHPDALIATGGVCLPVNVDYTIPTFASHERPLRDALPSFQASRGGLRYVGAPDVAGSTGLGAGGGLKAATGIWTEATDASPGAATKPVVTIACGTEQLVYVDAIPTRVGMGNLQTRFAPEQIAANMDVAMAAAASVAEQNLLNKIAASCTQTVAAPGASTGLGATRDFVTSLAQSVAAYRDAHRISDELPLTGLYPRWLRQLIRADLAREIGHSQNGDWNSLILSDEDIDGLFAPFNVTPVWFLDGQPTSAPGLGGSVNQYFVIQTGAGNILKFPTQVAHYLFVEGSMQFLDGGRLDLGVVRDSTLDATNDLEVFVEVFEGVAFRGIPSGGALQIISTISALGASTGTITTPPAA